MAQFVHWLRIPIPTRPIFAHDEYYRRRTGLNSDVQ